MKAKGWLPFLLAMIATGINAKAQELQWKSMQTQGVHGIRASVVTSDGSIVVASGEGGYYDDPISIYRSRDNGESWLYEGSHANYTLQLLALPDSLLMLNGGTASSADAPGSARLTPHPQACNFISVVYKGALFLACDSVILSTTNKGVTWSETRVLNTERLSSLSIGADGYLYVLTTSAIYRLKGLDSEWERFDITHGPALSLAVGRSGTMLFATYPFMLRGKIEGGKVLITDTIKQRPIELAISPVGTIYSFADRLYRSSDEGITWDEIPELYNFDYSREYSFCFDSIGHLFVFKDYESFRIGDTRPTFGPISVSNGYVRSVRTRGTEALMITSGYLNRTEISFDEGETWRYMLPTSTRRIDYKHLGTHPTLGIWLLLHYYDQAPGSGQKVSWYHLLHSKDGIYWTQSEKLPHTEQLSYVGTDKTGRIFLLDHGKGVTVSSPDGLSWSRVANALPGGIPLGRAIELGGSLLVPSYAALYTMDLADISKVSVDSSLRFILMAEDGAGNHLAIDQYGEPYAFTYDRVYTLMDTLPVRAQVHELIFAHDRWFAATDSGLYCSRWMHTSIFNMAWERCDMTLPDKTILSLAYDGQSRLYAGSRHSGLYYAELNASSVRSNNPETTLIAFPNPASDVVTISGAAIASEIKLVDQLGRVVLSRAVREPRSTLSVSHLPSGCYHLVSGSSQIPLLISR